MNELQTAFNQYKVLTRLSMALSANEVLPLALKAVDFVDAVIAGDDPTGEIVGCVGDYGCKLLGVHGDTSADDALIRGWRDRRDKADVQKLLERLALIIAESRRVDLRVRSAAEMHAARSHPGYEYETVKGPRKAFDDTTPPSGDGWVKNIHAGRGGWERHDYHEESYWMRPVQKG